jgi:hypothetical protein
VPQDHLDLVGGADLVQEPHEEVRAAAGGGLDGAPREGGPLLVGDVVAQRREQHGLFVREVLVHQVADGDHGRRRRLLAGAVDRHLTELVERGIEADVLAAQPVQRLGQLRCGRRQQRPQHVVLAAVIVLE